LEAFNSPPEFPGNFTAVVACKPPALAMGFLTFEFVAEPLSLDAKSPLSQIPLLKTLCPMTQKWSMRL
jgi:hypothetical protein